MTKLHDMLTRHEGLRLKPYRDSVGKLTIGVGRNLDDKGISAGEAGTLLDNDIIEATKTVHKIFGLAFATLDEVRQSALIDMAFNLGEPRLRGFKKMIAAIHSGDFNRAADEALDSRWAKQVGARAMELAAMLRTGHWQT